jgi:hypothetical protein
MQMLWIGKGGFYGTALAFAKMRSALAKAAGIPTVKMHIVSEDGDDVAVEVPDLDQFDLEEKNIYGEWDTPPDDPILYLLAHSDEAGDIKEEHMLPLASRLSELKVAVHDMLMEDDAETAQGLYRSIDHLAGTIAMSYAEGLPVEFKLEDYHP